MAKTEKKLKKNEEINQAHIQYYDDVLKILSFILAEYSKELARADIEFLEMPKNASATLDFLISSITKVQKGQRIALGLDNDISNTSLPQINIIEGLNENKI